MKNSNKKWQTLSVTIDIETRKRLESFASKNQVSIGKIVKSALQEYFAEQEGRIISENWNTERLLNIELWLQRSFFHATGQNQLLCRKEQEQIDKLVATRLKTLSGH